MINNQLINQALDLWPHVTHESPTAVSDSTVLQRYDANHSKLSAYLIASRLAESGERRDDILQLFRKMEPNFNESELRGLCFNLGVVYEDLNGQNRQDKLRELITYMERRQRLAELVQQCQELRPKLNWELEKVAQTKTAVQPKLNIAVVIDVARPILRNVSAYLDDKGLSVNFVVFRHQQPGKFFDVADDWSQLAVTFGDVMDRVKREFNGAKIHFFMSGPVGLLFAMGCIWGTVDEALVYHYENDTYHPVLPITRALRQIPSGWV